MCHMEAINILSILNRNAVYLFFVCLGMAEFLFYHFKNRVPKVEGMRVERVYGVLRTTWLSIKSPF